MVVLYSIHFAAGIDFAAGEGQNRALTWLKNKGIEYNLRYICEEASEHGAPPDFSVASDKAGATAWMRNLVVRMHL